jgi:anhydro-N-acetylmuramic acid kinase
MKKLYIGLMSGTSMDAIDAALVDFSKPNPQLYATHKMPMPPQLKSELNQLCAANTPTLMDFAELDVRMAQVFTESVQALLAKTPYSRNDILAIGSHGQTIFHAPERHYPFTLQIGDPNIIAEKTGITTIADFRRRDIAAGGQGAPLTPAFHNMIFRSQTEDRLILNLGGIANITYLPADPTQTVLGFDTGPANLLLDHWAAQHLGTHFDDQGQWAASQPFDPTLLTQLLTSDYFHTPPPKSTGREQFNLEWLNKQLNPQIHTSNPASIQATLCELTAKSVALALQWLPHPFQGSIFVCGGGVYNTYLMQRLYAHCQPHAVASCDRLGVPAEWVEAMAFAWLAKQTLEGKSGNLPDVTGAKQATILGGVYLKPGTCFAFDPETGRFLS